MITKNPPLVQNYSLNLRLEKKIPKFWLKIVPVLLWPRLIAKGRSLSWKPDPLRFTGLVCTQNSHRIVLQLFTIHWVVGIPAIYLAAQQMWSPVRGNPRQAAKPVKPVRQSPSESFLSVAGRRATDQHFEGEVFSFQQSKANENIVCSWDCGDQRRNR